MSENFKPAGVAMMKAWNWIKTTQNKTWGQWMLIGDGLMAGRQWAMKQANVNKPEGKGYAIAFAEWLTTYKVHDMHEADRTKLLQLMEERPAIEEWRAAQTNKSALNNPTVVWRKWKASTKIGQPKLRSGSISSSEHRRAKQMVDELQMRNQEIEEELKSGIRLTAADTPEHVASVIVELYRETAEEIAKLILAQGVVTSLQ